jgi:hypothetical protein
MIMDVIDIRVQVKGIVRVSYPFLGMGIAFTEISDTDKNQLEEILSRLAGETPVSASQTVKPARFDVASVKDPQATLKALEAYFQEHSMLSREHFDELVKTNGSR